VSVKYEVPFVEIGSMQLQRMLKAPAGKSGRSDVLRKQFHSGESLDGIVVAGNRPGGGHGGGKDLSEGN